MGKKISKDDKINRRFKISLIIFIIVAIITIFIVLNKGNIFGIRLIKVSGVEVEETHTIQLVADDYYLSVDNGVTNAYVTIDGVDRLDGFELVSSDEEVISVQNNKLVAVDEGVVTVTAISSEYNIQSEITVNVVTFATKLNVSSEYKTIDVGEQTQMSYTTSPKSATVNVKYASSDETVATVDTNGIVTGISSGYVSIILTDEISGKTTSYAIEVND